MLKRVRAESLADYFTPLGSRKEKGVYFCRLAGEGEETRSFLARYYEAARRSGVVQEGRLPNPDNRQLSYFQEMMGMDFTLSMGFLSERLSKWLPRMSPSARESVSGAIYDTLAGLQKAGKTENILKNAYVKFMCWLYYKFERMVNRLGDNDLPKILYEGEVGIYELLLLSVLSGAGCDILLLETEGDGPYLKADPEEAYSERMALPGEKPFPPGFSLKTLRQDMDEAEEKSRLYGETSAFRPCTNAWMKGHMLEDILVPPASRGSEGGFFYNAFCRMNGVQDRLTYQNELYQLKQNIQSAGRRLVIIDAPLPPPSPEEIAGVRRGRAEDATALIRELSANINYPLGKDVIRLMHKAFVDILLEEAQKEGNNINRLTNRAVYLLCYLRRYALLLFGNGALPGEVGGFFLMGGCRNENEALFLRFLSRLPVDVLIFCPNLSAPCCLKDPLLYEETYSETLALTRYPQENAPLRAGTAAYHAERDLDTLMYQDSGIYRNQQYEKANSLTLQTMYEEIPLLWDQELKYRPNFGTAGSVVTLPVIFAKVSGVKNGNVAAYFNGIKALITPETKVYKKVPVIPPGAPNPMKALAVECLRGGRLNKAKLMENRAYPYGILREGMQHHMLDKIQLLIDQKLIKGTFENGTEYTIVATALNLDKELVRLIQSFDFTRKNPKLVFIITGEDVLSLEDTILAAYLNLVGFDIIFYVPTGYQCIERHFNASAIEEHQIGEYLYDLNIPDFSPAPAGGQRMSLMDRIFHRG